MHTGREGMAAMPYFDDFDLGTVDILLISQYVPLPSSSLHTWLWHWRDQSSSSMRMGRTLQDCCRMRQQALPKYLVSMLYLRSSQYDAFQPLASSELSEIGSGRVAVPQISPLPAVPAWEDL